MSHLCSRTSFLYKGISGYRTFLRAQEVARLIDEHPEVEYKLKVIRFFDKHGLSATKDAFSVSRSTIYLRKKKLREKSLFGLANQSRRPYNTRRMYVDPLIYDFIKQIREQYPRMGKEKIKPLLDEYCQQHNLKPISVSKIGKIIKRNNLFFYLGKRTKKGKQYTIKPYKKRVFGYEVKEPGDLFQIDTIVRFEHGIKRYIYTAIDVVSRFGFAYTYKTKSSRQAADFITKLLKVSPIPIKAIQTDNGSEFLKEFDNKLKDQGIVHFFTYPKHPQQNAYIESFNRTIQMHMVEEYRKLLEYPTTKQFNEELIDYLLLYNTKLPHKNLNNQPPMKRVLEYIEQQLQQHPQKSNMYGTRSLTSN